MTNIVVIDGVRYVPATTVSPGVESVTRALVESFMGVTSDPEELARFTRELRVSITDDMSEGGETIEEFAARLAETQP